MESDIAVLDVGSGRNPRIVIASDADETSPGFSPDGKWIVYRSNESGKSQIYVQPFPDVDGGKWQVSPTSGSATYPIWNPRGGEIFYRKGLEQMAVPILSEDPFTLGSPTRLFVGPEVSGWWTRFAAAPDGERFLVFRNWNDPDELVELILVQNWFTELNELMPNN